MKSALSANKAHSFLKLPFTSAIAVQHGTRKLCGNNQNVFQFVDVESRSALQKISLFSFLIKVTFLLQFGLILV